MKTSKKVLSIVLSVAMILSAMVFSISAVDFDETWTAVTNASELKAIENDMAGKYYLANDIELEESFSPIGWLDSGDAAFTGTFDGNGKTVWGIETESGSNTGLFAINAGTIKNVTVRNAIITVSTQGGAIAGVNEEGGVISNCTVSDSLISGGFSTSSKYKYWLSDGYQVGGIVGLNKGTVSQCINNNTDVRGWLEVGGIVGHNNGTVSQCAATGNINSTNSGVASNAQINRMRWAAQSAYLANGECAYGRAGGVVGYNGGEVSDVFVGSSEGNEFVDIAGWNSIGGVCGKNEGSIKNAYAVSTKFTIPNNGATFYFPSDTSYSGTYTWTSDIYVHPMTASQEKGTTENSFYAEIVNGSIPAQATKEGKRGNEKTADEMKSGSDMYKEAGWDFDNVWKIDPNTKLPTLQFIPVECKHENTEVVGAKDPTCTEPGYTGDTVCKDCGEVISKGEVIPAKGHHDDDKDGKCDDCGKDMQEVCDHVWGEWTVTKNATCGVAGEETRTCTKCGKTETREIPATGKHTWNEGKVTKEATCTEDGEKTYTCTVCGATKTEVIPAKGHTPEVVGKKDATCDEEGYTGDTVCKDCGEVISKGETVPAKGHHDANGDGKCDDCGKDIGGGSHDDGGNNGGFKGFFSGLMNWFTRLMILVRHLLNMV